MYPEQDGARTLEFCPSLWFSASIPCGAGDPEPIPSRPPESALPGIGDGSPPGHLFYQVSIGTRCSPPLPFCRIHGSPSILSALPCPNPVLPPSTAQHCWCPIRGTPLWSEEMPLPGDCGLNPQPGTEPPATQQEMALAPNLTQLSLDLMCRRELTLSPGPTKLTPTLDHPHWMELILSTSPPELTLDPAYSQS